MLNTSSTHPADDVIVRVADVANALPLPSFLGRAFDVLSLASATDASFEGACDRNEELGGSGVHRCVKIQDLDTTEGLYGTPAHWWIAIVVVTYHLASGVLTVGNSGLKIMQLLGADRGCMSRSLDKSVWITPGRTGHDATGTTCEAGRDGERGRDETARLEDVEYTKCALLC
jgi:hypothetical protein